MDELIVARAAEGCVIAGFQSESIIARSAVEIIVSGTAPEGIILCSAIGGVITLAEDDFLRDRAVASVVEIVTVAQAD